MKLRIRYSGNTRPVHIDETSTVDELKSLITSTLGVNSDFKLSLNGSDELKCGPTSVLKQLDIVHGDLVHVLTPSQPEVKNEPNVSKTSTVKHMDTYENIQPSASSSSQIRDTSSNHSFKKQERESAPSGGNTPGTSVSEGRDEEPDYDDDEEAIRDSLVNRYLKEPMLVCDSTSDAVPQILQKVFENAGVCNEKEAVCVLLHALMSESGFTISEGNAAAKPDIIDCPWMPSGWKSQTTYRLTYSHQTSPGVTFTVLCVSLGKLLVVHGRAAGISVEEKCQYQLNPLDYVIQINPDAAKTYKNLPKLSRIFKDKIAHCLLDLCQQALGEPGMTGLPGMIEEVKLHVLSRLDARSLSRMARVNKEFNRISKQPQLWRRLYLKDFGRRTHMDLQQDWYKLYRDKHVLRCEMRERMNQARFVVPPFIDRPDPPFPFTPVYPPGFIGGDYDRFPAIPGLPGHGGVGPIPPRPRFDPYGPLPDDILRPGRGGGVFDSFGRRPRPRNPFGGGGGFGGFF